MFCLRQLRGAVGNAREGRTEFEHAVVLFDESELLESAYEDVHSQADAHHFRDDLLRHAGQRASTRAAGFQVGTRTTCSAPSSSKVPTERAWVSAWPSVGVPLKRTVGGSMPAILLEKDASLRSTSHGSLYPPSRSVKSRFDWGFVWLLRRQGLPQRERPFEGRQTRRADCDLRPLPIRLCLRCGRVSSQAGLMPDVDMEKHHIESVVQVHIEEATHDESEQRAGRCAHDSRTRTDVIKPSE
jgi:hypothetical protein